MIFENGQYITEHLIAIDTRKINEKIYTFLFDEENDISFFSEVVRTDGGYNFIRVKSKALFDKLIIIFSDLKDTKGVIC